MARESGVLFGWAQSLEIGWNSLKFERLPFGWPTLIQKWKCCSLCGDRYDTHEDFKRKFWLKIPKNFKFFTFSSSKWWSNDWLFLGESSGKLFVVSLQEFRLRLWPHSDGSDHQRWNRRDDHFRCVRRPSDESSESIACWITRKRLQIFSSLNRRRLFVAMIVCVWRVNDSTNPLDGE